MHVSYKYSETGKRPLITERAVDSVFDYTQQNKAIYYANNQNNFVAASRVK